MKKKNKSPRRKGRERAFQILYGCNFSPLPSREYVLKTFYNFLSESSNKNPGSNEFAWELITGVLENQNELDQLIAKFSQNWRIARIAKVELTILRIAVYEMFYREDVPVKVAINEGIELSKKYGDNKSSKFVNGILDAIAKRLEEGDTFSLLIKKKES